MNAYRTNQEGSFADYLKDHVFSSEHVLVNPPAQVVAKTKARVGNEMPAVMIDDTVFGTGKSGFLFTSHALFVLYDGRRIDLGAITGGPHYPRGDDDPGYLDTAQGPVMVPNLALDARRAVFATCIQKVVAWNLGDRASPLEAVRAAGPISAAACACLFGAKRVEPAFAMDEKRIAEARALTSGMDHSGGERLIAVLDETATRVCDEGLAFTDRQLRWRKDGAPDVDIGIPYAAIWRVGLGGGTFGRKILLQTNVAQHDIELISASDAVDACIRFLGTVAAMPPGDRMEASLPGERRFPSIEAEFRALEGAIRRGLDAELGADLARRLDLHARNERFGRGARAGMMLSPLSLADLRYALCAVLGEPLARHWDGATETLDFRLRQGGGSAGGAALSSAVGLALFATVGFGWVSVPRGPTITIVRFSVREVGGASAFTVHGASGHSFVPSLELNASIDRGLQPLEREMVRRRVAFGPAIDPRELGAYAPQAIAARIAELAPS
jgi:hypothetical protein